jgi:hypothetical protein
MLDGNGKYNSKTNKTSTSKKLLKGFKLQPSFSPGSRIEM